MAGDIMGWGIAFVGAVIGIVGAWLTIHFGKRSERLLREIIRRDRPRRDNFSPS
jgi:hypothetical protein